MLPDEGASIPKATKTWDVFRTQILFWCGLAGFFVYLGLIEFLSKPFHLEFVLAFLAMMGVGIAQSFDRRERNDK